MDSVAARVLVAFASKMGSNAEIAIVIGGVLSEAGMEVDVSPARVVRDLDGYDAVVLGSALYAAHWQRDAHRFVGRLRGALTAKSLWLWSSGPLDPLLAARDLPPAANVVEIIGDLPYRAHRTFGGRLDPQQPGVDPQILRTHRTGDFRDWGSIRAYASSIARELLGPRADAPAPR